MLRVFSPMCHGNPRSSIYPIPRYAQIFSLMLQFVCYGIKPIYYLLLFCLCQLPFLIHPPPSQQQPAKKPDENGCMHITSHPPSTTEIQKMPKKVISNKIQQSKPKYFPFSLRPSFFLSIFAHRLSIFPVAKHHKLSHVII